MVQRNTRWALLQPPHCHIIYCLILPLNHSSQHTARVHPSQGWTPGLKIEMSIFPQPLSLFLKVYRLGLCNHTEEGKGQRDRCSLTMTIVKKPSVIPALICTWYCYPIEAHRYSKKMINLGEGKTPLCEGKHFWIS